MGTTELLAKIGADGRSRAAEVTADRDRQIAEIVERQKNECSVLEQQHRERLERETRLIEERARSRARLEQRKGLLAAKWKVIERVFALAQKQVRESAGYDDLVKEIVERHATGDGVARLSAEDTGRFKATLGDRIGEPVNIKAGVVIEQGKQSLDFSVEESLAAIRDELAPKLDALLFPQG